MQIIWSAHFESDVKYYFKKKRYTKILDDIDKVANKLKSGNFIGDKLEGLTIPANTSAYKVRLPNSCRFLRHNRRRLSYPPRV